MNEETYNGIHEWVSSAEQYKPTTYEHRLSSSFQIEMVQIFQSVGSYPDPPVPGYNIHLILKGGHGTADFGGSKFDVSKGSKHTFVVAPVNTTCEYEVFDDLNLLSIYLPILPSLSYVETVTGSTQLDLGTLHDKNFRDPFIQQLLLKLWNEAAEDNLLGSLFIDHTAYTLISALLYKSQRLNKQTLQTKGLTKKQMQQVIDHIHDRLTESLSLQDLSQVLGIQEWELARAFKKTTGLPPYQYVLEQRVYKAKELIETTALPLAQIALEVGFSSQAHLTRMFKKVLGYPPSASSRKYKVRA